MTHLQHRTDLYREPFFSLPRILKWGVTTIVAAFLVALIAGYIFGPSLVETERASTVTLYIGGDNPVKATAVGSGVYLGHGLILTARHAVVKDLDDVQSDRYDIYVVDSTGKENHAKPVLISESADYAIIRVPDLDVPAATLTCRMPVVDEPVTLVGTAYGFIENGVAHGTVSSTHLNDVVFAIKTDSTLAAYGWSSLVIAAIAGAPGDSGGPVYDANGDVIGVMVAGAGPFAGFVPTHTLCGDVPHAFTR